MNILVRSLSRKTTEEELTALFAPFGTLNSVVIVKDKATGQSKGFGFVDMPVEAEALAAIKKLNARQIDGERIRVKNSVPGPVEAAPAGAQAAKAERAAEQPRAQFQLKKGINKRRFEPGGENAAARPYDNRARSAESRERPVRSRYAAPTAGERRPYNRANDRPGGFKPGYAAGAQRNSAPNRAGANVPRRPSYESGAGEYKGPSERKYGPPRAGERNASARPYFPFREGGKSTRSTEAKGYQGRSGGRGQSSPSGKSRKPEFKARGTDSRSTYRGTAKPRKTNTYRPV